MYKQRGYAVDYSLKPGTFKIHGNGENMRYIINMFT